jgi:hypothetical protein
MENLNKSVSVQKPSLSLKGELFTTIQLSNIQHALLDKDVKDKSLNVLDLLNPLPRSILLHFLIGKDY